MPPDSTCRYASTVSSPGISTRPPALVIAACEDRLVRTIVYSGTSTARQIRTSTIPLLPCATTEGSSSHTGREDLRRLRGVRAASATVPVATPWRTGTLVWLRSEEHTSELQSRGHLVCRLLLEKKK